MESSSRARSPVTQELEEVDDADLATATEKDAAKLAGRLRQNVESKVIACPEGQHLKVTASFGVAAWDRGIRSVEEFVGRADAALYAAKEGGRNRVEIWQPNKVGG